MTDSTGTEKKLPESMVSECLPIIVDGLKFAEGTLKLSMTKSGTLESNSVISVLSELKTTLLQVKALTLINMIVSERMSQLLPDDAMKSLHSAVVTDVTEMAKNMKAQAQVAPKIAAPTPNKGIWVPK